MRLFDRKFYKKLFSNISIPKGAIMSPWFSQSFLQFFISIPKGAIMSILSFALHWAAKAFQFQKVRLWDTYISTLNDLVSLFQFQKVRLWDFRIQFQHVCEFYFNSKRCDYEMINLILKTNY